jgi:hypothetical protein
MPNKFYAIDDAIAEVIQKFEVETLNRLAPPRRLASHDDLTGLPEVVIQQLVSDHCANFEAGRPDDGALLRVYTGTWIGSGLRGMTEVEAQWRAKGQVAALDHETEARLRARPGGWEPPAPPPPRLRRFEVEGAIAKLIDDGLQQGDIELWHLATDGSMQPVPRSTAWRLSPLLRDGEWVISRDRIGDPQRYVGLHLTEAGREALLNAVRNEVGEKPPLWPQLLTPAELEKRLKDKDVTRERWDRAHALYVRRLQSFTPSSPPKLELRPNNRDANPNDYDREWAKNAKVNPKAELPILRAMYIPIAARPPRRSRASARRGSHRVQLRAAISRRTTSH